MAPGDRVRLRSDEYEGLHSYADVGHRLDAAVAQVRERVPVANNSRVARWSAALGRLAATDRRSVLAAMVASLRSGTWDHPHKDGFRALVDSRMFTVIVEELSADLKDEDLRDLVAGNYHPALDSPGKRTRDREFELFIAAAARRAGLGAHLLEPDIVLDFRGTRVSVAAKRLSSPKRVEDNVKKAAEQIRKAGVPGFIFLDATRILDSAQVIVTHWRTVDQTVGGHLLHFSSTEHRDTLATRWNEYVRGVVLRTVFPHISEGFRYGSYESWWALPVDGVDATEVHEIVHKLLGGLEGS